MFVRNPPRVERAGELPQPGLEDLGIAELLRYYARALPGCGWTGGILQPQATDVHARLYKGLDQGLVIDTVAGQDEVKTCDPQITC